MSKPRLLDTYCGGGGCSKGYMLAGFHVTGVDNRPQPHYCGDEFVQADALQYIADHGYEYDAIHASPPCQAYTRARVLYGYAHPDLLVHTRALLIVSGLPYVIENVPGAPMIEPFALEGQMFGLRVIRRRLFECNFPVAFALMPSPNGKRAKMGRLAKDGELITVAGRAGARGVSQQWKTAMDIDWMTITELAQAIPPAYTRWIGEQLLSFLEVGQ